MISTKTFFDLFFISNHLGKLRCSLSNYTTLGGMLTNIFGFPSSMSLEIYTEEQDEFLCIDEGDEYSCKICQQSMESPNEIYIHLKTHLDKQYDDNLKSFNENQNCSLCCVCNQNFLGIQNASNDPVTDGARDAIKTHYESHVHQLKQYLSKKVIFRDYYVIGKNHLKN